MNGVSRYDELVNTVPGRCFRYIEGENGRPVYCPEQVSWRGQYRPPKGAVRIAESCDEHSGGLYRPTPLPVPPMHGARTAARS